MRVNLSRFCAKASAPIQHRCFAVSSFCKRAFQEGDYVLLEEKRQTGTKELLVKLKPSGALNTHRGIIQHDEIIGKQTRQLVRTSRGLYRIHEPTLADYVRLTPRLVTPIYPADANLIVSLLDIHVDTPSPGLEQSPPYEILEAGTGHGALTLHLARAIHAANPPVPKLPSNGHKQDDIKEEEDDDAVSMGESLSDLQQSNLEAWRASRRAILHTLDISSKHSKHARKIVQGFRRGMYAGNVDFHVGDVSAWVAQQQTSRQTKVSFLTHILLDLPNANLHLANVAPALNVNGTLAVFNPNITQIVDCVETVRKHKLPYLLDQVIELGASTIREWEVRAVRPRASPMKADEDEVSEFSSGGEPIDSVARQEARDDELAQELAKNEEKWATVCRPSPGKQVVGGGFLAVWRKMEPGVPDKL